MSDCLIACSCFGVYAKWLLANVSLWHNASADRVWCLVSDIVTAGNVDPLQASWCKVQGASCTLQVVSGAKKCKCKHPLRCRCGCLGHSAG